MTDADIGAAEGRFAVQDVRPHHLGEGRDFFRRDPGFGPHFGDGAVEGNLRDVALGLYRGDPLLQGRV